ncbi:site-specific DNA-methyltransferase [Methylomicrobium sp. Wu6]|uniref:site-specific DNA-methyltransferase n=1 Tax=Methylomicrobium sp. Wu6 TaxID=3107928 RepID=UPI002DD63D29|nr:site-specific DNA-methyltransferase [Methylomicrobium sp. Wu6]MEC4747452.1 site-specific DNA-methyltransferase [Methylomicrobium sp. Wu6]
MPLLDWLNKAEAVRAAQKVPYRLLEAVPELGAGDPNSENMLIQGDNLQALKALLPLYAGKVKCIYIDPPYNTRSAFTHYDDNLEHSLWLSLMYPRLELLRELLAEDGSIWVSIDDNEAHYLKVMMDEVFGRNNFIVDVSWKKRDGAPNDRKIGATHEHILVWAKSKSSDSKKTKAEESFNLMPRTEKADSQYQEFDEPIGRDPRGAFRKIDTTANGKGGRFVESLYYPITNPYTGEEVWPRQGTCWRHNREEMMRLQNENRLFWGAKGTAKTPMRKLFKFEAKQGMTTPSIWDDTGFNQHASAEIEKLFGEKAAFETPKPEALLFRIIHIATNPNDLILDSFLGSGTTVAVAHKMQRRYIGIEMGEHAQTHCQTRLKKVVEGEQGGISKAVNWQGGSGFHFFRLGEPIFDEYGSIHHNVRFASLAAHIWFCETRIPLAKTADSPLLGIHDDTAYYLLYNGILGDRRPQSGNVLTQAVLDSLPPHTGRKIIYGEASRFGKARLEAENIVFKQIPAV